MVLSQLCLVLSGTRMGGKKRKEREGEKERATGIGKKGETEILDEDEGGGRGQAPCCIVDQMCAAG